MSDGFLDGVPLWAVLLGLALSFLLSGSLGYRVGRRRPTGAGNLTDLGATIGGLLGLLGLLLAFTFGMAGNRFDRRKELVVDDANAIGTAWLRADLIPEPGRTQAREILKAYTDLRIRAASETDRHLLAEHLRRTDGLQRELWGVATAAAGMAPTPTTALFVAAVNELIDVHGRRIAVATRNPVPPIILWTLSGVAVLVLAVMGYARGMVEDGNPVAMAILSVILAVVLGLIVDLERPLEGHLKVSQHAMAEVRAMMDPAP